MSMRVLEPPEGSRSGEGQVRAVDADALAVAMAMVPGLYARNRLFSLFARPDVKRAKARASMLRGVVRQLAGSHGEVDAVLLSREGGTSVLRYRVARVRFERRVELSDLEASCLRFLAARIGVTSLAPAADDQARVEAALRKLGGAAAGEARALSTAAPTGASSDVGGAARLADEDTGEERS